MKTIDDWTNCYPSNWKGLIVEGAFAHPAKFSNKLIRKIYEHMFAEGWLKAGDTVVDPFGGVALGAFDAMRMGLSWKGVELESRFVLLGNENIDLWNKKYSSMPHWGDAELVQGDSRFLAQVLGGADAAVSSPPYADSINPENGIDMNKTGAAGPNSQANQVTRYGRESAQLGAMKATEAGFNAAVSSPPFSGSTADGGWQMLGKYAEEGKLTVKQVKGKKDKAYPSWSKERDTSYAPSPENLGNAVATESGFQASISSPPFQGNSGGTNVTAKSGVLADAAILKRHAAGNSEAGYGEAQGNLGSELGDDFWTSARTIVEQVYQVLEPGAHAVWVTKRYVKNKAIVEFTEQWIQMCEAVGFQVVCRHRALLTEHKGTVIDLDGNHKEIVTKHASFFRRLAEKKGSPAIDWEDVTCMVK